MRLDRRLWAPALSLVLLLSLSPPAAEAMDWESNRYDLFEPRFSDLGVTAYSRLPDLYDGVMAAADMSGRYGLIRLNDDASSLYANVTAFNYSRITHLGHGLFVTERIDPISGAVTGIMDKTGQFLLPEAASRTVERLDEGLIQVTTGGSIRYYDLHMNPTTLAQHRQKPAVLDNYDSWSSLGSFYRVSGSQGMIGTGILDERGEELFWANTGLSVVSTGDSPRFLVDGTLYRSDRSPVTIAVSGVTLSDNGDGKTLRIRQTANGVTLEGVVDLDGNVVVPLGSYTRVGRMNAQGYITVYTDDPGGNIQQTVSQVYHAGSATPRTVTGVRLLSSTLYQNLLVYDGTNYGYQSNDGSTLLRTVYAGIYPESGGRIRTAYRDTDASGAVSYRYGLYTEAGAELLAEKYRSIVAQQAADYYIVEESTGFGAVYIKDGKAEQLIPTEYRAVTMCLDELFLLRTNTQYLLVNPKRDEHVIPPADYIELFSNDAWNLRSCDELWNVERYRVSQNDYHRTVQPFCVEIDGKWTTRHIDYVTGQTLTELPFRASNVDDAGWFVFLDAKGNYGLGRTKESTQGPRIAFDPGLGVITSGLPIARATVDGLLTSLPTAARPGWDFLGWVTADRRPVSGTTVFREDATVYAQWKKLESENVGASGYCGPDEGCRDVAWTLEIDGRMTLSGEGEMNSVLGVNNYPFYSYRSTMAQAEFEGGVTCAGAEAFSGADFSRLNSVLFCEPEWLEEGLEAIYARAFRGAPVERVYLPDSVAFIDDEAFRGNERLTDIYYGGSEEDWEDIRTESYSAENLLWGDTVTDRPFWDDGLHPVIHYNSAYVRYMNNDGLGAPAFQGFERGDYIRLSETVPGRTGYVFTEWNTEPDGSGTVYLPGGTYLPDGPLTLYAQWFALRVVPGTDYPAPGAVGVTADRLSGAARCGEEVKLVCRPAKGETIYYTLDPLSNLTTGQPADVGMTYTGPIVLTRDCVLRAQAVWAGNRSPISTYIYSVYGKGTPLIYAQKTSMRPGGEFRVPIYMENSPGVSDLRLALGFDHEAMTLVEVSDTGLMGGIRFHTDNTEQNPTWLYWENQDGATAPREVLRNGPIATLTFRLHEDAELGNYPLSLSMEEGDALDSRMNPVPFSLAGTSLTCDGAYLGDVDDNDVLEALDATLLLRQLALWRGYADKLNQVAADVNRDESVSMTDAAVLLRHLAKWDGYKNLPADYITYSDPDDDDLLSAGAASLQAVPTVSVSSGSARVGETVDVTVSLSGNPGLTMLRLQVDYDDEALTLVDVKDGGMLGSPVHGQGENLENRPYTLLWCNATARRNYTGSGALATLTFRVDKAADKLPITVQCEKDDAMNADLAVVSLGTAPGSITVGPGGEAARWGNLSYRYDAAAKTILVYGTLPKDAVLRCAQYDAAGRMLAVRELKLSQTAALPAKTHTVKLFLTDQRGVPLASMETAKR